MKRILSFVFLLQFTQVSFSQTNTHQDLGKSVAQNQQLDEKEYLTWDKDKNQWELKQKTEYKYDDQFRIVSTTLCQKNNLNVLETFLIHQSVYDDNVIQKIKDTYSKDYKSLIEKTYDENNHMILRTVFNINKLTEQKSCKSKDEYAYDENGYMTQSIHYTYKNNSWNNHSKQNFVYDDQGNIIEKSGYYHKNGDWNLNMKNIYAYDNYGNQLTKEEYNLISGKLESTKKTMNAIQYTGTGDNVFNSIASQWDKNTDIWETTGRLDYEYDKNGNLFNMIYSIYEEDAFKQYMKDEYFYDTYYEKTDLIVPSADYFDQIYLSKYQNQPTEYIRSFWNEKSGEWANSYKYIFKYSTQEITAVNTEKHTTSKIYPNPTSNFVTFSSPDQCIASFELFDIHGKMIMKRNLTNLERINLINLCSGMYFYNIRTDMNIQSGKLVKK